MNFAKVTFFSLHLSYGSGESIKRPAFLETVTDIDRGCCCTLRVLVTDYSPLVSLSRLGDLLSLCPRSFQKELPHPSNSAMCFGENKQSSKWCSDTVV